MKMFKVTLNQDLWTELCHLFLKKKSERKSLQERTDQLLEIRQRVVTFIKDSPARGTVRYIGNEEDGSGNVRTIVGLEMVGNALINKKIY